MSVERFREKIIKHHIEDLVESLDYYAGELNFESPIEQAFFEAFWTFMNGRIEVPDCDPPWGLGWSITLQETIGDYRADFVIRASHGDTHIKAVVECDGHEFHERTKEQAARDRRKDRDLQGKGFLVLRYTGAEIYQNPCKCACDAHGKICSALDRVAA